MHEAEERAPVGLAALRAVVAHALEPLAPPSPLAASPSGPAPRDGERLLAESVASSSTSQHRAAVPSGPLSDENGEQERLAALVDLARSGDRDAFGELYDHYHGPIFRFLYYRVGSTHVAEDLLAETFLRALRNVHSFRWQGRDFGAWLTTIARNLATDHFKAGRTRLERPTEDQTTLDTSAEGPEQEVLTALTNQVLLDSLHDLPADQRDCLVMRFLQGLSIAETATALDRSPGAVKQLQLRAVRNLASRLPEGLA